VVEGVDHVVDVVDVVDHIVNAAGSITECPKNDVDEKFGASKGALLGDLGS
jgi:hypothetical protein